MGVTEVVIVGTMDVFGSWLPWLFGVGTVLLVGGLVAKEFGPGSKILTELGRRAVNVGWRMMLLAVFVYLMVRVLEAVFSNLLSNLPGT